MESYLRFSDKKLFDIVRGRPAMFIGEPVNIHTLSIFWGGYSLALINNRLDDQSELMSRAPSFDDWVAMKEGYEESTSGWARMIAGVSSSDEDGIKLFFQYLDEYFSRKATILYERQLAQKEIVFGDNRVYKDTTVQLISYDQTKKGVFLRLFDKDRNIIGSEGLYSSYTRAQEAIKLYYSD